MQQQQEEQQQASTSGREPQEEAKWAAFDAMVESWLGGSRPRVEVRLEGDGGGCMQWGVERRLHVPALALRRRGCCSQRVLG